MVSNCYALWLWHGIQHKKGHSWNWGTQMIQFLVSDAFKEDLDQKGEMWDWKEGTSLEIQLGGLSHPINSSPIAEPDRGTLVSNRKSLFSYPRRRKIFSSLSNSSVNRKSSPPWILFLPMYFYSEQPLPTSSFFLYNVPLLCFLDLPMVLP